MSFIADKQTLVDLNLLGKFKQNSIFSLFNNVKTTGGEQLLNEMFQKPLIDAQAINRRSDTFKYFQSKQTSFPWNNEEFSQIENYLSIGSANSYAATLLILTKQKLLAFILKDEAYQKLQTGLLQTITVLNRCKTFITQFLNDKDYPFENRIVSLGKILDNPKLEWLVTAQTEQLSLQKTARYHFLLRHTLRSELRTVMDTFYQLDVYIAVANLAMEKDFRYAQALPKENQILNALALRHPSMTKAVRNQVNLNQHSNMIFLTGANMAGKSTFMKAFGINIYLAHMGFPVAAIDMQFSVKQGIYSSINVPDNLDMGYSHFYAEVLRVKTVAAEVSRGKNLVVIFDELFKGTNVKDAYDATLAVTQAFSEYGNCLFIISTHIIEAGEMLQQQSNIQPLYLPTVMKGSIPTYTYQLQSGISSDRHGMMIIENEGILAMLYGDNT